MELALSGITLNCHGILTDSRRKLFYHYFTCKNLDFIFLQETYAREEHIQNFSREWKGSSAWAPSPATRSGGTAILFSPKFKGEILKINRDPYGRYVIVEVKVEDFLVNFINIYAPNNRTVRKTFFSDLLDTIGTANQVILAGDFNFVEDVLLDSESQEEYKITEAKQIHGLTELNKIKQDMDLIDPFRSIFPVKKEFTFVNKSYKDLKKRLDRFYISRELLSHVKSIEHWPSTYSDHSAVFLKFSIPDPNFRIGPGYWKCNVKTLKDEYFKLDFLSLWKNVSASEDRSAEWWENAKLKIKRLIIAHFTRLNNIRKNNLKDLENSLRRAQNTEKIAALQSEISGFLMEDYNAARIRARVKHINEYERPTKYFLLRENLYNKKKTMTELNTENGKVTSTQEIMEEFVKFYKNLLSRQDISPDHLDYFLQDLPSLTEDQQNLCEGLISVDECWEAIKRMKNDSSPGIDGLPREFYFEYFHMIGEDYVRMINNCFVKGKLADTQRRGLITLLPKDPLPLDNVVNWRPISLLCVDYKILSKVICNRIQLVLEFLIHPDQKCAVPGRSITDNIHLIRDICNYTEWKDQQAAIISLDQTKAFDRVSHEFLFSVLKKYNFGLDLINWVRILYTDISSSVMINKHISEPFLVTRSVRQGCSLSPALYILSLEPFAIKIRNHEKIVGLKVPGSKDPVKLTLYADDLEAIVTTVQSITELFRLAQRFMLASGSLVNKNKSFGIWIGRWKDHPPDYPELIFKPLAKIYGIIIGTGNYITPNLDNAISKTKKKMLAFQGRFITMRGKAVIIKTLFINIFVYIATVLPIPNSYCKKIQSMFFQFLWSGKPQYLKQQVLYAPFNKGGLNMVHVESKFESLKAMQIIKFINHEDSKWTYFAQYYVGRQLRVYDPSFAFATNPHAEYPSQYYTAALSAFNSLNIRPDLVKNQTTKILYTHLINNVYLTPPVENEFADRDLDFSKIWSSLSIELSDPHTTNLNWQIMHGIIPVRHFLKNRNIINSSACSYCGEEETIEHLLILCPMVAEIWDFFTEILSDIVPIRVEINDMLIFFNIAPNLPKHIYAVFICIISHMRLSIWKCRNRKVFQNENITPIQIRNHAIAALRFKIRADFERLPRSKFIRYWCINNALVKVCDQKLEILFHKYQT